MSEEENKALNDSESENTSDVSPISGETTGEVESTPEVDKEATSNEDETETGGESQEGSSKKGYQARVRELVRERNEARAEAQKAKSLSERMSQVTRTPQVDTNVPPVPQVAAGSEVTPEQYQQHVMRSADALVTLRVKQADAVNRINNEAQESVRKYPELDPESEGFNKELSETITEAVEAYVKSNPYNASVKSFVDRLMKPYKGAVDKGVGEATENLAKQVSQAATKPTSVRKGEKKAEEKSIAELEAELGIVQS